MLFEYTIDQFIDGNVSVEGTEGGVGRQLCYFDRCQRQAGVKPVLEVQEDRVVRAVFFIQQMLCERRLGVIAVQECRHVLFQPCMEGAAGLAHIIRQAIMATQ